MNRQREPGQAEVAVVTRDRAATLVRYCLPGLVEIVRCGARVLIVDQSASEETAKLVSGHPISYLRSTSVGLSNGRNLALHQCSSEWIVFTDDDVVPSVDWYQGNLRAIQASRDVAAVLGRGYGLDGRPMRGGAAGKHKWPTDIFHLGSGYSLALNRRAALAVGGFDPEFGAGARFGAAEDTLMLYKLLVNGYSVLCADEIRILHPDWRPPRQEIARQFRYGRGTAALTVSSWSAKVWGYAARRLCLQVALIAQSIRGSRWIEAYARTSYLIGFLHPADKFRLLRRALFRRYLPSP